MLGKYKSKVIAGMVSLLMLLEVIMMPFSMAAATETTSSEVGSISLKIPRNDKDNQDSSSNRQLRYFKLPNSSYTREELIDLGKKYEAMDMADVINELGEGTLTETSKLVSHNEKSYDEILINNLEAGSYVFKETEASEQAHQYKFITIADTIEAGAEINELITKVTVRKRQPVTLHKIGLREDSENNEQIELAGVKFNLLDKDKNIVSLVQTAPGVYSYAENDANAITELLTNKSGNIVVNDLPEGSYTFHEIKTVEGYIIDKYNEYTDFNYNPYTEKRVTVNNYTNPPTGINLRLHKYDMDTNESLEGVKFKLYIKSGNNFTLVGKNDKGQYEAIANSDLVFTTDENGYISINNLPKLPEASTYVFREVEPAVGYEAIDTFYQAKPNGTIEVANYKNPKPLELTLTKTDSTTGETLDRVGFELYKVEIAENDNGTLSNTSKRVAVYGENGSYDFSKGADNTTEEYQLYTDANGRIVVKGLPDGEYFFKENKVKSGYDLAENMGKESTRLKRGATTYAMTNKPELPPETPPTTPENPVGGYNFVKVDDSEAHNRLADATFALYKVGEDGQTSSYLINGQRYTVKSGSNGEFQVSGLPYGKYVLRETAAPEGYILDVNPIEFEISATSINNEAIFIENKANPERPPVPPVVSPPSTPTPTPPSTPNTPPSTRTPVPPQVSPPTTYYVPSNTPGVTRGPLVKTGDIRIVILVVVGILMIVGGSFLVRKSEKEQKLSLV